MLTIFEKNAGVFGVVVVVQKGLKFGFIFVINPSPTQFDRTITIFITMYIYFPTQQSV